MLTYKPGNDIIISPPEQQSGGGMQNISEMQYQEM